jgi:hypothetical protein
LGAFPVLELDRPHPMPYPLVQLAPDLWSLRQPEVSLPSQHIDSQLSNHFLETASARTTSQSSDTLLEHCYRLVGQPAFDCPAGSRSEAVTQKLALEHTGYCALGRIHLKTQFAIEPQRQDHYPLARTMGANTDIRIVRVAHQAVASPFQFLVHFVEQRIAQQRRYHSPYTKGNFQFERTVTGWRARYSVLDLRLKR